MIFILGKGGFWTGRRFSKTFADAKLFATGGECLDVVERLHRRWINCAAGYALAA